MTGGVISIFTETLTVAVLPAVSVTLPVTTCPAPSVESVCGLEQLAIGRPPRVHVKLMVTGELFQPLELGAGLSVATMAGWRRASPALRFTLLTMPADVFDL